MVAPLCALTREFLHKLGYQVLEAEHGEDGIRVAGEFPGPIHLLLTDVIMPGMNGPEMASQIKPGRSSMKVLYVSGYTHDAFAGGHIK